MNTICKCKKQDYICRQVSDRLTYRGDYLWVCATCCLPHRLVAEGFIRPCRGCLSDRCLPWETYCYTCFKIEFPDQKYYGLRAASKAAIKRLTWPLPKTRIEDVLADKPLQRKGSEALGEENTIQDSRRLSETI